MKTKREAEDRSDYFRAGVGAMLVDAAGRILAMKRTDAGSGGWQMPQGGIRPGEDPEAALARELGEETGLAPADVTVLAVCPEWLVYELPEAYRNEKVGRGQVQRWFLCRLRGSPEKIVPDGIEFSTCEWVDPAELIRRAPHFRRPVYSRLLNEFAPHFRARRGGP
jgi:putative (di)nucleoside polyphosphate hydrolase